MNLTWNASISPVLPRHSIATTLLSVGVFTIVLPLISLYRRYRESASPHSMPKPRSPNRGETGEAMARQI